MIQPIRQLTPEPEPPGITVKSFSSPAAALAFIAGLKSRKIPPPGCGMALRDRTPAGELIAELNLPEAGALTLGMGGGLLGKQTRWLRKVRSVQLPGIGPVIVGGLFADALQGGTSGTFNPDLPRNAVELLTRLGLDRDQSSSLAERLREGKALVVLSSSSAEKKNEAQRPRRQRRPTIFHSPRFAPERMVAC